MYKLITFYFMFSSYYKNFVYTCYVTHYTRRQLEIYKKYIYVTLPPSKIYKAKEM